MQDDKPMLHDGCIWILHLLAYYLQLRTPAVELAQQVHASSAADSFTIHDNVSNRIWFSCFSDGPHVPSYS